MQVSAEMHEVVQICIGAEVQQVQVPVEWQVEVQRCRCNCSCRCWGCRDLGDCTGCDCAGGAAEVLQERCKRGAEEKCALVQLQVQVKW